MVNYLQNKFIEQGIEKKKIFRTYWQRWISECVKSKLLAQ